MIKVVLNTMNPANVIGHGNKTAVFPNSVSLGFFSPDRGWRYVSQYFPPDDVHMEMLHHAASISTGLPRPVPQLG
jgi:hypothetical protein